MERRSSGSIRLTVVVVSIAVLAGCGIAIPADPDGTLERVRGETLEVGISSNPPWTDATDDEPTGIEVELVEEFAGTIDADVEWEDGGEETLMGRLERGELDLVIGGLTDASPWGAQAALTKPFVEATGEDGTTERHVMAAPLGENAFLLTLERFLLDQDVTAP